MCTAEAVCLQLSVIALFFIVCTEYNTIVSLPTSQLKVIENQSINDDIEVFSGSSPVLTEKERTRHCELSHFQSGDKLPGS